MHIVARLEVDALFAQTVAGVFLADILKMNIQLDIGHLTMGAADKHGGRTRPQRLPVLPRRADKLLLKLSFRVFV